MANAFHLSKTEERRMATREKLLVELLKDCKAPGDLFGQDGLLKQFTEGLGSTYP